MLVVVTPRSKQPVDLGSFWHPRAKEFDKLAKGAPSLIASNSTWPVVLRTGVMNFTTDPPGGDEITNFKGASSCIYNRLRQFQAVYVPASSHIYYPPKHRANGSCLLKVHNCVAPRRAAASICASAAAVEDARAQGNSVTFQTRLEQERGVKGYSLFFAPSPDRRAAYPHLQHLWDVGPTATPYDAVHLVLLNVVPHTWKLFAVLKLVNKNKDEEYIMAHTTVTLIVQELRRARRTVPYAQARTLGNIDLHHTSFKAVDCMHIILST